MDLRDEKPSRNSRDIQWVPTITDHWTGGRRGRDYEGVSSLYPQQDSSLTGQPYGNLTPDEIEMMKSGASIRELLFMRLMNDVGQPGQLSPVKNSKK